MSFKKYSYMPLDGTTSSTCRSFFQHCSATPIQLFSHLERTDMSEKNGASFITILNINLTTALFSKRLIFFSGQNYQRRWIQSSVVMYQKLLVSNLYSAWIDFTIDPFFPSNIQINNTRELTFIDNAFLCFWGLWIRFSEESGFKICLICETLQGFT